jgi:hypothetical protein
VAGQIEQDIDAVSADSRGECLVSETQRVDPVIREGLKTLRIGSYSAEHESQNTSKFA